MFLMVYLYLYYRYSWKIEELPHWFKPVPQLDKLKLTQNLNSKSQNFPPNLSAESPSDLQETRVLRPSDLSLSSAGAAGSNSSQNSLSISGKHNIDKRRKNKYHVKKCTYFTISPHEGVFLPHESKVFHVLFNPVKPILVRARAILSVHGVPKSYQYRLDQLKGLGDFDEEKIQKLRLHQEASKRHLGQHELVSLPLLDYDLQGEGCYCTVELNPKVLLIPSSLYVGQSIVTTFTLKNTSQALCPFKWQNHPTNLRPPIEHSDPVLRNGDFSLTVEPQEGVLHPNESFVFKVALSSEKPGLLNTDIHCDLALGIIYK